MFFIVIVGAIAGGAYGIYKLNDELYPYTIKDFDYNIKNCLQDIRLLSRDASYVRALAKAKACREARRYAERKGDLVSNLINSFDNSLTVSAMVYNDNSYRGTIKESDIQYIVPELEKLGFSVKYTKEDYSYRDDVLGTLTVSVETK